jgi:hypothetical protein
MHAPSWVTLTTDASGSVAATSLQSLMGYMANPFKPRVARLLSGGAEERRREREGLGLGLCTRAAREAPSRSIGWNADDAQVVAMWQLRLGGTYLRWGRQTAWGRQWLGRLWWGCWWGALCSVRSPAYTSIALASIPQYREPSAPTGTSPPKLALASSHVDPGRVYNGPAGGRRTGLLRSRGVCMRSSTRKPYRTRGVAGDETHRATRDNAQTWTRTAGGG